MTQEEKRIKLAEAAGFTQEEPWLDGRKCWGHKKHPNIGFEEIPDYFNDLNVVHELEKVLNAVQRLQYMDKLGYPHNTSCTFATASQRCEALGLTLNLWK